MNEVTPHDIQRLQAEVQNLGQTISQRLDRLEAEIHRVLRELRLEVNEVRQRFNDLTATAGADDNRDAATAQQLQALTNKMEQLSQRLPANDPADNQF